MRSAQTLPLNGGRRPASAFFQAGLLFRPGFLSGWSSRGQVRGAGFPRGDGQTRWRSDLPPGSIVNRAGDVIG